MNFVVGVQIEAAETELAFLVGNVGCDVLGANVLQINDGGINRSFVFVDHRAANRAQFGLTLGKDCRRGKYHHYEQSELSGRVHGFLRWTAPSESSVPLDFL